ncbi:pilin [Patescibacteria group bacterium]|nr:pilin [Patescibacteria group bacterium]
MKKTFIIFFLLFFLLAPIYISAQDATPKGIVRCGGPDNLCTLNDLLGLPKIIGTWLLNIVTALAVFFIIVGGIVLLASGGNPERKNLGKKILLAAVIGVVLAFGARAIINFILSTLGYKYDLLSFAPTLLF